MLTYRSVVHQVASEWCHRPYCPHNRWVDQIRRDNNLLSADLWRHVVNYGHHSAMLYHLLAKRRKR